MYKHILVPTDGSELSKEAIRQAKLLASALRARITVLYVQAPYPQAVSAVAFAMGPFSEEFARQTSFAANEALTQAKEEIQKADVACKCTTSTSDAPWQVIINTAKFEECDLIVMASHGRSGVAGLVIGSQTQKVLTHCKIPVLVCR
ncbi:MAG TPA: universal stress protein [Rhodocyclaceae bacterium]|nr:universal stress protein [Rhodocyclaceae bacterium]